MDKLCKHPGVMCAACTKVCGGREHDSEENKLLYSVSVGTSAPLGPRTKCMLDKAWRIRLAGLAQSELLEMWLGTWLPTTGARTHPGTGTVS